MVRRIVLLFFVALLAFPLFAQGNTMKYYTEINISDSYATADEVVDSLYNDWFTGKKKIADNKIAKNVVITPCELNEKQKIFTVIIKAKLGDFNTETKLFIGGMTKYDLVLVNFIDNTDEKEKNKKPKYDVRYDDWIDFLLTDIKEAINKVGE